MSHPERFSAHPLHIILPILLVAAFGGLATIISEKDQSHRDLHISVREDLGLSVHFKQALMAIYLPFPVNVWQSFRINEEQCVAIALLPGGASSSEPASLPLGEGAGW
jgi:hypothetical protein